MQQMRLPYADLFRAGSVRALVEEASESLHGSNVAARCRLGEVTPLQFFQHDLT
jgi:hypothetical protein